MIAESYERIHRSNLVGMGIIPFQYVGGQTADSLGLTGTETFSIDVPDDLKAGQELQVKVSEQGHFECHNKCTNNWGLLPNYFLFISNEIFYRNVTLSMKSEGREENEV